MQQTQTGIIYSASDLANYLDCRHLTSLDQIHLATPLSKAEPDEGAMLLQKKGDQHERAYLEKLQKSGIEIASLKAVSGTIEARVSATMAAMRAGAAIIYQGIFCHGSFIGYPDFLRRVEHPSALGSYSYEVLDTKLARTAKGKFLVQLALYSELVGQAQGIAPSQMAVVLGDGREVPFQVRASHYYFKGLKQRFLGHVETPTQTYPLPCERCESCHWRERCEQRREEDDHLSLVANITRGQVKKLEAHGLKSLAGLAQLMPGRTIPTVAPIVLERLHHQAALQYQARVTGQPLVELITQSGPPESWPVPKGFARMPAPDAGDLFFDMEGDPHEEGGLEYLFGIYILDSGAPRFQAFWAHYRAEEKRAFEAFIDFVTAHLIRHPAAHIYHYGGYEKTALRNLMGLHGSREAEVDNLLRGQKLVDLYTVVREAIRTSEPSYSLKYIEHFYLDRRAGEVTSAGASIVTYERWKVSRDAALLKQIEDYNHDDVRSTFELRQWLLGLRPSDLPWAKTRNGLEDVDASVVTQISESEQRLARYRQQLIDPLPQDPMTWGPNERLNELIFQLLDFHRRAAKPQWWSVFDRRDRSASEHAEDLECVAGLTRDPAIPPMPEKRSIRYTYVYPGQETKLKTGDSVRIIEPDMPVTDFSLDEETQRVTFKLSAKREQPPEVIDLGLGGPVNDRKLREAVARYADAYLARESSGGISAYPALDSMLRRDVPRVKGRTPGQPLIIETEDPSARLQSILDTVGRLENSHVVIQGPPGSGKTYTGSHLIVELLRQGKRVGVSSNSHKAIVNMLHAVERMARDRGVSFLGVKKHSGSDPSQLVNGQFIADEESTENILGGHYQLIAGTAWLFAEPGLDRALDYLFIDEAGQVSLANLVGIGTSAHNLVLLGDQMQLAQPIQGTHPGQSGLSSLDYLLEGRATIPPERGIFLATTWRLHPEICRFISAAVYEDRLKPERQNLHRELVLQPRAHPALKPAGIGYVPVQHVGCAQASSEEANVIRALYDSLLQQAYTDKNRTRHPLTHTDILVVAPYNMQVALLRRTLPAEARVGTVDKFQGQEAAVVLFSMATSSGEELPRNIEFLFSKNRLNVALSRAQCLALLVASPALLAVDCRTPEQIELVNTLCWIAGDYATGNLDRGTCGRSPGNVG